MKSSGRTKVLLVGNRPNRNEFGVSVTTSVLETENSET